LTSDKNVLRTPAVIVDTLLGQGEALNCFAMKIPEVDTDIHIIQELLGHKSSKITEQYTPKQNLMNSKNAN